MARPGLNTEVFEVVFKEVFALLLRCLELIFKGSTKQMKYSVPVEKVNIDTIGNHICVRTSNGGVHFSCVITTRMHTKNSKTHFIVQKIMTFTIKLQYILLTQCEVVWVLVEAGCLGID